MSEVEVGSKKISIDNLKEMGYIYQKKFRESLINNLLKAGEEFTPDFYFKQIFLPLTVFGVMVSVVLQFMVFPLFQLTGPITFAPLLLPFLTIGLAIVYPMMYISGRSKNIEKNIHLFATYLGVISTTGPERKILFRMASEKEEFGVVANEMKKILKLADSWNMGFIKASRIVSKNTPSLLFKDFLDRLAHSFQSGEQIEEFLRLEVDVVMKDYERMYRQSLYTIESTKEIYMNMVVTLSFVAAFALIFPMLSGMDMTQMVYLMIGLFVGVDIAMFMLIKSITPEDDLYHSLPTKTEFQVKAKSMIMPVFFLTFLVFTILLVLNLFTIPVCIALSQTPWLIVAYYAKQGEKLVIRKDDNFPTFIRTVGSSAGVRGGSITPIIAILRLHNYGPLTTDIRALYRRLSLGDTERSWRYFAGESGSNLIDKFSRIFIEAAYSGGDPHIIGETISKTFQRINTLRKFRLQSAASLKSMLYSAMLGIAISIYAIIALVAVLAETMSEFTMGGDAAEFLPMGVSGATDLPMDMIMFLLWILILLHSGISAVIIKMVEGGDLLHSLNHYVILLWIGTLVTLFTPWAFENLVPI